MLRIGLGKDLHRLVPGRRFILGGVEIPFEKGEEGHSDGDVLVHALIDALLGAATGALGRADIGQLFPDTDPRFKDADSMALLRTVKEKLDAAAVEICNIDCVVSAEQPKILPWRDKVLTNIVRSLNIDEGQISLKAKTGEGLGPVGRGEAVEAEVIVLVNIP
jgi:2-C-methyl-D-erythritol 2,4-cyclodiphosphate synthase/2-C-methyl-D-erythritol 4-phosphate cytidylyltransferase/2-C-methyl-D-erythritol 2,4-cyclodiphosphate synthase